LITAIDKIRAQRFDWRLSRHESLHFEVTPRALGKAQINTARKCPKIDAPPSCQNCNSGYHTELIRGTNIAFKKLAGKLGSAA
jgi:hypothetical protein